MKRTLLYVSVEMQDSTLTKLLVDAGCPVNAKERCGLTPLCMAVLKKNTELTQFLVDSGAKYDGPLFTSIPSPLKLAKLLELKDIVDLFDKCQEESDGED